MGYVIVKHHSLRIIGGEWSLTGLHPRTIPANHFLGAGLQLVLIKFSVSIFFNPVLLNFEYIPTHTSVK